MFNKRTILVLFFVFISFFGYVIFSDAINTAHTDFYFKSGSNYYNDITMNLTGGNTGNIDIYLENKGNVPISGNFLFVDGYVVTYGSTGLKACKAAGSDTVFGQYVSIANNSFSLNPGTSTTRTLDLNFPDMYSGIYNGCVIYGLTNTDPSDHEWNTAAYKSIFLDVDVMPGVVFFEVKAYPSNRQSGKWGNYGKLFFYSGNRTLPLFSGFVTTNTAATGEYIYDVPSGVYDVVYKGQGQLSSYLSGITITGGQINILDFTTGNNLYSTRSGITVSDQVQIAGDIVQDDYINSVDLSSVVDSQCNYGSGGLDQYFKCNLNGDSSVSIADVQVIVSNAGFEGAYSDVVSFNPEFDGFNR